MKTKNTFEVFSSYGNRIIIAFFVIKPTYPVAMFDKCTVLKTGPDRPVQPVQPETESQSGPVKSSKTDQQPENRPKTGVEPKI